MYSWILCIIWACKIIWKLWPKLLFSFLKISSTCHQFHFKNVRWKCFFAINWRSFRKHIAANCWIFITITIRLQTSTSPQSNFSTKYGSDGVSALAIPSINDILERPRLIDIHNVVKVLSYINLRDRYAPIL